MLDALLVRRKIGLVENAFIQTRVEDEKDMAFIKIRGVLAEVLVSIRSWASTMAVNKTDSVATVGELASSLEI